METHLVYWVKNDDWWVWRHLTGVVYYLRNSYSLGQAPCMLREQERALKNSEHFVINFMDSLPGAHSYITSFGHSGQSLAHCNLNVLLPVNYQNGLITQWIQTLYTHSDDRSWACCCINVDLPCVQFCNWWRPSWLKCHIRILYHCSLLLHECSVL